MKHINILTACFCVLLFYSFPCSAQNPAQALNTAQQMPAYPGGSDSLLNDITNSLVYPKACADSGIEGKVFLRFIVDENGGISDAIAVKGPNPLLKQAALDGLTRISKKFTPGMQDGKPVKVWYNLPVTFKIIKPSVKIIKPSVEKPLPDTAYINIQQYYPGGPEAFETFIKNNLEYPKDERVKGLEASIMVKCRINDSAKLYPTAILNSLNKNFDDESLRLINLMPPLDSSVKLQNFSRTSLLAIVNFILAPLGTSNQTYTSRTHGTRDVENYGRASSFITNPKKVAVGNYNVGIEEFKRGNLISAKQYFDKALEVNTRDQDAFLTAP